MPDIVLGEIASDWIEIKTALTSIDLTSCSFLTMLEKLYSLANKNLLVAKAGLEMQVVLLPLALTICLLSAA